MKYILHIMSLTEQMKRNGLLQSQVVLDYFICGKNGEKNKEGAYAPSLFFEVYSINIYISYE
ncbi:hypothetical protein BACI71_10067 [Bacillus mycoides]|uniref:Uncharacterized protein n=1 Tax=Bacillus mycoides TaxID=1405 RepID=A0A653LS92_BACMY|nr:hypothetical protein BACI71_10067 [Bacillus mycoides]